MSTSKLLTDEDRILLKKVSSLLEEIIETLEIIEDKETMEAIKKAEDEAKAGKIRNYDEFIEELRKSGEI
jgi:D-mannonate dehydratase